MFVSEGKILHKSISIILKKIYTRFGLRIISLVVNPVNDAAPVIKLLRESISLKEKQVVNIDANLVQLSDEDTDDEQLTFLVSGPPKFGLLEKQGWVVSYRLLCFIPLMPGGNKKVTHT